MKILRQLFAPAKEAFKKYALPFLLLQFCAVAVVITYYIFPAFQEICARIEIWKVRGGIFFAAWTTALSGGILPEIAKSLTRTSEPNSLSRLKNTLFNCALFAIFGISVDLLFRFQGILFGYELNWQTILKKTLFDQFLSEPLYFTPIGVLFFEWRRQNFNLISTLRQINPAFYRDHILPLLSTVWLYWIPMVACIYALPENLQFPFYVCVNASWSLLLIYIVNGRG